MTGYQEILTDPSYKAQIVTMINPDGELRRESAGCRSWRPHVAVLSIRELSPVVSNWRAALLWGKYLEQNDIRIQASILARLTKSCASAAPQRLYLH